jgi:hypothetical protein
MTTASDRPAPALDADTLASFPVWRFLTEGESADPDADESFVRAQSTPPAIGEHASYLVAATYKLANGRRLPGLVQADVLGSQLELDPCAIYASGKQVDPLSKDAEMRLTRILHEENTRPVEWELAVSLIGESKPRRGAISSSSFMRTFGLLARLVRLKGAR